MIENNTEINTFKQASLIFNQYLLPIRNSCGVGGKYILNALKEKQRKKEGL